MIDTKEIRKALAIHGVDVLNVDEVLDVLDHLEAAYKEIESWKGVAKQFGNDADTLRTHLSFAKDELNRLRTKIAEMENQEPVAWCATDETETVVEALGMNQSRRFDTALYLAPGAQPAPSLASDDVSLISEGKTQPAQSVKGAIIDDLQSQFDTEGITEHDSGDALIRLSDAIAAVEDNFAQPEPSVPEGWKLVPIVSTPEMDEAGSDHCDGYLSYLSTAKAVWDAMLAAAPEAKP